MAVAFLIGRIIVGLYYINSGIRHFTHLNMMAGYAGSKGVPLPKLAVPGSGALLVIGGLSLLLGYQPVIGIAAVVLFLIGVSPMMHNFWAVQDPMQKMAEMVNFTKNMALLGSALMFLAIPQPWAYSV
ncbi:MAG: DoxX family protein [Acidobacteria bacterium]|nr:MAG: DoxX family protein [Acidobacteriota bacterium]